MSSKLSDLASAPSVANDDLLYVVPAGGGAEYKATKSQIAGLVLLDEQTATNAAALDFATSITSDYDEYEIHLIGMSVSVLTASICIRMSTDGGSTYDSTSGHYSWAQFAMAFNATGSAGNVSDSVIALMYFMTNVANITSSGKYSLYQPLNGNSYTLMTGLANVTDSSRTTDTLGINNAGKYLVLSPVNAFRILANSGTFSGIVRVYGITK